MKKKPDYRTKDDILKQQRWEPLIGEPGLTQITTPQLRVVDDFLVFLEGRKIAAIWDLTKRHFIDFDVGYNSVGRLRVLKAGLSALFPRHPSVLELMAAIREKDAAYLASRKRPKPRPRVLTKSVPESALSAFYQDAIADMCAGFDRNSVMAPAAGMMSTHVMKLRQLVLSARKAGLTEEISTESVRAYARDLRARDLSPVTLLASFSSLLKMARYTGAEAEAITLLYELNRIYDGKAAKAPKTKYQKLQNTGYSPLALINTASALLKAVDELPCPRRQHAQRNGAAAIALFSVMPVRLADTRLTFGETIFWVDGKYTIETVLSKGGDPWGCDVDPRLNRFIEALILRGCDPAWLPDMREKALKGRRPLFINGNGSLVGYNYVSDAWRKTVGTGEHIARTILHTFLGIELGMAGTGMAKAACGQRSVGIEAEYQDDALKKVQRLKGQAEFADIITPEERALFEFR
ncbi:hypothetical protein [Pontibaca salina]|uniref:Uncharacterized protein n=1 Tax=Pontibaca salina TaxID=2795731 RepID=A0A934HTA7_9RHOB|nr:hypothetical protein [Pontibaca salina]MBI6630997.1 hypothetical protein [Pontibaca salina]